MLHDHHFYLVPKHFHHQRKTYIFILILHLNTWRPGREATNQETGQTSRCRCGRRDALSSSLGRALSPFSYPQSPPRIGTKLTTDFPGGCACALARLLFCGRSGELSFLFYFLNLYLLIFFFFLGPHLWPMEVSRLGVESQVQLLAYTTATATLDQATSATSTKVCSIVGSLLSPLSGARDRTFFLMETSQVLNALSHNGNSKREGTFRASKEGNHQKG